MRLVVLLDKSDHTFSTILHRATVFFVFSVVDVLVRIVALAVYLSIL